MNVSDSDTFNMRHVFQFSSVFLAVALGLCLSQTAQAADGAGSQVGLAYGLSIPDAEDSNPHYIAGIKGAAYLTPTFGLGGYYLNTSKQIGTGSTPFDYSLGGIDAIFHLGGGKGDTFVSFRVGMTKVHTKEGTTKLIYSPYHYGGAAGYDYYLTSWLTLGFEGSFTFVEASSTNKSGTRYELDSFSVMNFLATLQFRL